MPALTAIWQSMHFPVDALIKRVTGFQVAEDAQGTIVGAVALQIAQKQGRIMNEGYKDFSHADQLRPILWERIQSVSTNHGLLRLWTKENSPFWSQSGLEKAGPEILAKLPEPWKNEPGDWLTLKLREDLQTAIMSVDQEFALFMDSEKRRTQRAFQQAKILKFIAVLFAIALLGLVVLGAIIILTRNPQFLRR
jgi:hypothetical protein